MLVTSMSNQGKPVPDSTGVPFAAGFNALLIMEIRFITDIPCYNNSLTDLRGTAMNNLIRALNHDLTILALTSHPIQTSLVDHMIDIVSCLGHIPSSGR